MYDPAIMTTFLWADCQMHGSHKSMHLDSCCAIGLVDVGNVTWAYSVATFLWADYHTPRFSHLHYPHQVSEAVHNSAKSSFWPAIVRMNYIRN